MNTPQHIAIICDGNRRWAREHHLEVVLGHKKAVDDVFEPLVDRAAEHGVQFVTFWVFSTENWQREKHEVDALLQLFRNILDKNVDKLNKNGVKIRVIGDVLAFPQDIQDKLANAIEKTKNNQKITVVLALNYGGRDELVRAVNKISEDKRKKISAEDISRNLDTQDIPDPDYIIRTGGEQRLSGFMLWQSEYAELAFPEFYFPDFTPEKLDELLVEFEHRKRRFGK